MPVSFTEGAVMSGYMLVPLKEVWPSCKSVPLKEACWLLVPVKEVWPHCQTFPVKEVWPQ